MSVSDMPGLNATLNGISAVLLTLGFIFIKSGNKTAHRNCMVAAFCTSSIFLVSYVTHKILIHGKHTKLGADGLLQTVYYVMLFSHVVLAMAIVPLVLVTIFRAKRGDFDAHKRIARWTWPIWMYVSVTGVLIYFFLYQWWPAA